MRNKYIYGVLTHWNRGLVVLQGTGGKCVRTYDKHHTLFLSSPFCDRPFFSLPSGVFGFLACSQSAATHVGPTAEPLHVVEELGWRYDVRTAWKSIPIQYQIKSQPNRVAEPLHVHLCSKLLDLIAVAEEFGLETFCTRLHTPVVFKLLLPTTWRGPNDAVCRQLTLPHKLGNACYPNI